MYLKYDMYFYTGKMHLFTTETLTPNCFLGPFQIWWILGFRDSPAQKMYVPKGHAAQIFMCLYAFLCAFLIKSIKVNKSLHI